MTILFLVLCLLTVSVDANQPDRMERAEREKASELARDAKAEPLSPAALISNSLVAPFPFNYVDISGGTPLLVGFDQSATVPLVFPFYGVTANSLQVANAGYLSTDNTDGGLDFSNDCPLPAVPSSGSATGARIYPLHDDVITSVYHQFFPVSPVVAPLGGTPAVNVFQWKGTHFGTSNAVDFEALLFETGEIVFQYLLDDENGSESTVGIQSSAPFTDGSTTVSCNTPGSVLPNTAGE